MKRREMFIKVNKREHRCNLCTTRCVRFEDVLDLPLTTHELVHRQMPSDVEITQPYMG